jgi:hypothetical protein
MEASEQARIDEDQDANDDFLMHRDDDTVPESVHTEDDGDVGDDNSAALLAPQGQPDNELERPKPKRPRSQAQKVAFEKVRKALAEKRARDKAEREANRRSPGRPASTTRTTRAKPKAKVVFQRAGGIGTHDTSDLIATHFDT